MSSLKSNIHEKTHKKTTQNLPSTDESIQKVRIQSTAPDLPAVGEDETTPDLPAVEYHSVVDEVEIIQESNISKKTEKFKEKYRLPAILFLIGFFVGCVVWLFFYYRDAAAVNSKPSLDPIQSWCKKNSEHPDCLKETN